jgi:hypothetical protein
MSLIGFSIAMELERQELDENIITYVSHLEEVIQDVSQISSAIGSSQSLESPDLDRFALCIKTMACMVLSFIALMRRVPCLSCKETGLESSRRTEKSMETVRSKSHVNDTSTET